jgi:hypothetical protein
MLQNGKSNPEPHIVKLEADAKSKLIPMMLRWLKKATDESIFVKARASTTHR